MRQPDPANEQYPPEAESALDARRHLPEGGVLLHGWFCGWEIRSFPGGVVCAFPLDPPYGRFMELRDFYAWLPDYEKIFRHLPEDSSPFAPFARTEVAAALEELQLKPPIPDNPELTAVLEHLTKIADAFKPPLVAEADSDKSDQNKKAYRKSKQRVVTEFIIEQEFPDAAPDVKTVLLKIQEERVWKAACSRLLIDPSSIKRLPSPQTVTRILSLRETKQVSKAIIHRCFPHAAPDVAVVLERLKVEWKAECSRLLLDPRFVDLPSPQMISCILSERETKRGQTPPASESRS